MTKKALLFGLAVLATGSNVMANDETKWYDTAWKHAGNVSETFGANDLMRFAQILALDSTDADIIKLVNGLSASVKGLRLIDQVAKVTKKKTDTDGAEVTKIDFLNTEFVGSGAGSIAARMTALVDAATIYNDAKMVKEAKHLAANNKRRPVETPLELQPGMLEAKVGVVGKTALFIEGIAGMGLNYFAGKAEDNKTAQSFLLSMAYLVKGIQRYQIWAKQNSRLKEVREQLEQQGVVSQS